MNEHGEIKKHTVRKAFILFAIGAVVFMYVGYWITAATNPDALMSGGTTAVSFVPLILVGVVGWLWWPKNK